MNEYTDEYLISFEEDMKKAVDRLFADFSTLRVGRANPKVLDRIVVDYYGTRVPINQTANIQVGDARMLVITPWDMGVLKNIVSAINDSNLGLNASDDGQKIRIVFPVLTEERRKDLVKEAKNMLETCKISLRNCRRDVLDVFKDMKKASEITEDDLSALEKQVQKLIDKYNTNVEEICEKKIAEIMEV